LGDSRRANGVRRLAGCRHAGTRLGGGRALPSRWPAPQEAEHWPKARRRAQGGQINQANQANLSAKRDIGRLASRADTLLRRTVEDGAERPGAAVDRFLSQQKEISSELSSIFNTRVKEDEWLPLVTAQNLDLALGLQALKIRLAPTPEEVTNSVTQPLPTVNPAPHESAFNVLLTIALDTPGLRELSAKLVEQLLKDGPTMSVLKNLRVALKAKQYGQAALELEALLKTIVSPRLYPLIVKAVGGEGAKKVLRAIVVRFVPFIGWAYTATCLLVSIYHNRDKIEALL